MAGSFNDVIKKLEEQRAAIERALLALREIESPGSDALTSAAGIRRGPRKGGMTPEGRRRLSEALKARWAAKKAGASAPPAKAKRKGGITAAGRKRLSEALKARWAAKRATAKKKSRG